MGIAVTAIMFVMWSIVLVVWRMILILALNALSSSNFK
jgi:hypothetical protein